MDNFVNYLLIAFIGLLGSVGGIFFSQINHSQKLIQGIISAHIAECNKIPKALLNERLEALTRQQDALMTEVINIRKHLHETNNLVQLLVGRQQEQDLK